MRFVIVTGMSGAGKTSVLKFLEDINFFCVDNIPPALLPKFAELCYEQEGEIERVAMGIDIRGGKLFNDLFEVLSDLQHKGYEYEILFLDASDDVLIKRYKETRRSHPLSKNGSIQEGIQKEREILKDVKRKATYIIDTSQILTRQLKEQINRIFVENQSYENLMITVQSFEESRTFLKKLVDMPEFLIPHYIKEGKNSLVISIGCTGGKHRSVTLTNALYNALGKDGHTLLLKHNDIEKDSRHKK